MSMFPKCDGKIENPVETPAMVDMDTNCDGTLVPIKLYKSEGAYSRTEWMVDWRCTKCSRTM